MMQIQARSVAYWITTALVAFSLGSGGLFEVMRTPQATDGMVRVLGYPAYFVVILGVWKLLGTIAILAPRLPRLKEWAYAGIFFDATGATASHAAAGDNGAHGFHIWVTLLLALLTIASWALRPPSRTLGSLFKVS
jgi:uncharacterized membrane protein YphA (DoxX/SURF4 family)